VNIEKLQGAADGTIIRWSVVEERIETFVIGWQTYIVRVTESQADQAEKTKQVRAIVDASKPACSAASTRAAES